MDKKKKLSIREIRTGFEQGVQDGTAVFTSMDNDDIASMQCMLDGLHDNTRIGVLKYAQDMLQQWYLDPKISDSDFVLVVFSIVFGAGKAREHWQAIDAHEETTDE